MANMNLITAIIKPFKLDDVKNAQLKPYEDKAAIKTLVEPFKSNGKIVKTEADAKLGTTTFTLSNGAKVTYKKTDFKEDEIVFSAISLGGSSLISTLNPNMSIFSHTDRSQLCVTLSP